jgi:hypothetical protein
VANPQVEKLKALGMRHGEKAVVGLAAALCLLLLALAVSKPTTSLTADQVANNAKSADQNLGRQQPREEIIKKLEDDGVKNPGFVKLVDAQEKEALSPVAFKPARPWVTPEPGAGLIRDTPELIAPKELYAYPGRGGALIFALDDAGKRIPEDPNAKLDEAAKERRARRPRRNRNRGGGMPGYGAPGGGMAGYGGYGGAPGQETEEQKKDREKRAEQLKRMLAGSRSAATASDRAKEEAAKKAAGEEGMEEMGPQGPFKEVTKGLRWVAITGVLDHKKMKENYATALKNPGAAPNYKQLDVQRQVRQDDGSWSDWEDVDIEKNRAISYNLPEEEEELTPDTVRIDTLVDPLPFLKAGLWDKVHVVSLVPKERRDIPKPETGMGGYPGMGGMAGGYGPRGGMAGGYGPRSGGMAEAGGYGMSGYGSMGGGGEEFNDFQKSEEDTLMVRSLDFTVEPDTTYRFRLRVVVYNPNYKRENVSPGVDTEKLELQGPWSDPTNEVTMPADVTAYAVRKTPAAAGGPKRTDQVQFMVARWNPEDGVTTTRTFDAGPGELVGEPVSSAIPNADGEKAKSRVVDYNTHNLVLDTNGGLQPVSTIGASGGAFLEAPALSLMMRPDGSVVLRSQVYDGPDPVRKDMDETYKREVNESGKRRQSSQGYGGMPGYGPGGR